MTTKDDEVALTDGGASAKPEGAPDVEGWLRFLEKEVDATRNVFLTKPKLLLGHVRSERQTADDYAGRELLELVQNAADAAAEMGGGGRVRIEIDADGLIVANTGHPFRTGGVESLMTPNASDKPGRKVALIGAKGLGFRSLLNWSHEPVISSGALEIGFSRAHAEAMIASLAVESGQIATLVQTEDDPPVPILAFPAFGDALSAIHSAADRSLVGRARNLRALGYDTVVAAPFDDERAMGRAVRQAGEFEPTFLLFVESLEEIELKIADRPLVRWSRTSVGDDTYRIVADVGGIVSEQSWICMRRRGELVVRGRRKPRVYELSVALRTDESNSPGVLHSYFPTSIPLPFPALLHATLELDSNRKAIKEDSDLNEGVLKELGAFYVDTLARLSRLKRVTNPLDYLARTGTFPQPLKAFEAEVYRAARPLKIIPTIRGGRVSGALGRVGPVGYSNESVIASLRTQAARALKGGRRDAGDVQRSLLRTLHSLYDPTNRNPPGVFKVLSADGAWRDARELHLSASFGQPGRVNAALFASAPQHLLALAEQNGLDGDATDAAAFFEWIGVNRWPRAISSEAPADLRPVILRALPDEITVTDGNSHQDFGKGEISWGYNAKCEASMIVGLEGILATAESDAILAWLALDQRFDPA